MTAPHNNCAVLPARASDFARFFAEHYRPPVLEMPGLIECSLLRETDDSTRYQMVFRWEEPEQAVAWRVSEAHQALQPALNELHSGMAIVAYERLSG
jgi:heme-degrading monooxygenase HmoA